MELVNGLIKRTEYAADLLQKYRILNGIKTYKGTTISRPVQPIIFPYDEEMVLDEVYDFPSDFEFETDADGFVPLDKRKRLIVPQFVQDNPTQYAFRSIGYFWAKMDNPPSATQRYPSWGNELFYITQTIAELNSFAFGPHPPFANIFTGEPETAWYGGSGSLIRI